MSSIFYRNYEENALEFIENHEEYICILVIGSNYRVAKNKLYCIEITSYRVTRSAKVLNNSRSLPRSLSMTSLPHS